MSPPESPSARYRFGTRVLDPARRELRCDDVPQQLPARTFECLHYLIAHRDRAVGRDELVRAVFGRRAVSDAQLAQIVLRARRAIGDDGQEQRAIRTVPRFGFRWAADVEVIEAASTEAVRDAVVRDVMPQATMPVDVPAAEVHDDEAPFGHAHTLAANLRRAFSGIVAGNVKEEGMRLIEQHGPFEMHGDPDIMQALDALLRAFVDQRRMKMVGEYRPCYRVVA